MTQTSISKTDIESVIDTVRLEKMAADKKLDTVREQLDEVFRKNFTQRTVLGIDVYRYSKYGRLAQALIPYVLRLNLDNTIANINTLETVFFHPGEPIDFKQDVIDTGDGAYIVFPNPLQAIVFLLYFQANLQAYNSANTHPELTEITKALSIRYCLTLQYLYLFESRWYGPAIIDNARILAADRLNRLLVDAHVKEWFDLNTNGLETLAVLGLEDYARGGKLKQITQIGGTSKSLIFPAEYRGNGIIRNVNLCHVGEVAIKEASYAVFSLHMQCYLNLPEAPEITKNVVTVGNLNAAGIGTI